MGDTSNSNGNATAANSVTAERNVTMAGSAVNGAISSTISGAISSALPVSYTHLTLPTICSV